MRALVSSGRSDFGEFLPGHLGVPACRPAAAIVSTVPLPPVAAAASNAVARTVITLTGSFDCTVANALPA